MEQKLTIHEKRDTDMNAQSFWPAPLFMNPMAMDPIGWSNDLFDITHRNMSQMFDGLLDTWPVFHHRQPTADVTESESCVHIKMEVPVGIEAKDIEISTKDGLLTISGSKKSHTKGTLSIYSFSYSTDLPENLNIDRAGVTLSQHRLNVNIPKNAGQTKTQPAHEQRIAAPVTSMKNDGHRKEKQHP